MGFSDILSYGSFVVLGAVIYMLGERAKPFIRSSRLYLWDHGFKWVYEGTLEAQPVVLAVMAYQTPGFPLPDGWETRVARLLLGVACGLTTSWTYRLYRKALQADSEGS